MPFSFSKKALGMCLSCGRPLEHGWQRQRQAAKSVMPWLLRSRARCMGPLPSGLHGQQAGPRASSSLQLLRSGGRTDFNRPPSLHGCDGHLLSSASAAWWVSPSDPHVCLADMGTLPIMLRRGSDACLSHRMAVTVF